MLWILISPHKVCFLSATNLGGTHEKWSVENDSLTLRTCFGRKIAWKLAHHLKESCQKLQKLGRDFLKSCFYFFTKIHTKYCKGLPFISPQQIRSCDLRIIEI